MPSWRARARRPMSAFSGLLDLIVHRNDLPLLPGNAGDVEWIDIVAEFSFHPWQELLPGGTRG